jgi:hypothetical protein
MNIETKKGHKKDEQMKGKHKLQECKRRVFIKLRTLQWAGHVQRMESQSIPRMVMAGQKFGKCPVGKPKKRWMDAVNEDSYQILNWRNWEVKAQDRDE